MRLFWITIALATLAVVAQAAFTAQSGYIQTDATNGVEMFYWMFGSQHDEASDPVVLWLTGGPGCSSMLAALFENGPYFVDSNSHLYNNTYSWNMNATVIFLDQPPGAGFSYATKASGNEGSSLQVGENVWKFLQGFLKQYPHLAHQRFYVTGESYGGHWVPNVASAIHAHNSKPEDGNVHINMHGLAIGNGWVDPYYQAASYAPFLYSNGLIGESTLQEADQQLQQCQSDITNGNYADAFTSCGNVLDICLEAAGDINVYNIKTKCVGPLCYDLNPIIDYLNEKTVQSSLGVNRNWVPCSSAAYQPFAAHDFEFSYRAELPLLLQNYDVLIYNGELDLMCNFYGTSAYLDSMPWSGKTSFNVAANTTWGPASNPSAGTKRSFGHLHYYTVHNAGHMVPHDQGAAALYMLEKFLNNQL